MKSFLLIGQSNMAGRGFVHEVPSIYNERIEMLRNGRWQMMTEPINYDRPVAGVSSIDEWETEGVLFRHAVSEAKFAVENSELAGILWHQGESDSDSGKYKMYYEKLYRLVTDLREALNAADIPFIIGGLGDYLGKTAFGAGGIEYERINQELQRFAEENPCCYFVTAKGLTANPDGIHINAVSQRKFGLRYFEAYSERKHIEQPLAEEDRLVDRCHNRDNTTAEKRYLALEGFTSGKISYEEFRKAFVS